MQESVQMVCSWYSNWWLGWKNQEIGLDIQVGLKWEPCGKHQLGKPRRLEDNMKIMLWDVVILYYHRRHKLPYCLRYIAKGLTVEKTLSERSPTKHALLYWLTTKNWGLHRQLSRERPHCILVEEPHNRNVTWNVSSNMGYGGGWELCSVVGFCISNVEFSGLFTRKFVM
jgi:hypothetical protein